MPHDACITLTGELAYESEEEIRDAAESISFEGEIYVEDIAVNAIDSHVDVNMEGEEVEVPPTVLIFFWIETYNGIDYAEEGESMGLEMDLSHKLQAPFHPLFVSRFDWTCNLSRMSFCSHPKAYHDDSKQGVTFCSKCEGPITA